MKQLGMLTMAVAFVVAGAVRAEDKPNPTGTWTWSVERNGQTRTTTLKLKLEGDKLSGAIAGRMNMETAIENGTFKDGEVSFSITRDRNGTKTTTKYSGKLSGDTIKGKTEREGGKDMDWEAKRSKDAPKKEDK